jgi:hypothetical protein
MRNEVAVKGVPIRPLDSNRNRFTVTKERLHWRPVTTDGSLSLELEKRRNHCRRIYPLINTHGSPGLASWKPRCRMFFRMS